MDLDEIALAREFSRREVVAIHAELGAQSSLMRPGEAVAVHQGVATFHEARTVFADAWESKPPCGQTVHWWDGEYEGSCVFWQDHSGDHFDGTSWFDDCGECMDSRH